MLTILFQNILTLQMGNKNHGGVCNALKTISLPGVLSSKKAVKGCFPTIWNQTFEIATRLSSSSTNATNFESKRDLINFPRFVQLERNPPTVFGFIPQSWLDFFYPKTGVSGGYMFFFGTLVYLTSKEIYILNGEAITVLSYILLSFTAQRYFPEIRFALQRMFEKDTEMLDSAQILEKENIKKDIEESEKYASQVKAVIGFLPEAKRENVYLQMEAVYRMYLQEAYLIVKNRLDYLVEKSDIETSFAGKQMVAWVLSEVHKSLTPEMKRTVMLKSIEGLKTLASKNLK